MNIFKQLKTPQKIVIFVVLIAVTLLGLWQLINRGSVYQTFTSPDERFKIVVYRRPMFFVFPGQSGDASGYAQLVDKKGNILKEEEIDMVGFIDNNSVKWLGNHVEIDKFITWGLPTSE